jgi:uncharacterized protein (TIGR02466 family)
MINNLFSTPVLVEQFADADSFNASLLKEATGNYGFELFDLNTPSITILKNWIKGHVDDMAKQYKFRYSQINGRQNIIKPFESDTPHHHVGKSILVGVYYADVPPNSGDILLQDPRGPLPWENLNFIPNDPIATKSARCYHRIKPQNGLLLLFPGFIIHSVETNLSNRNRTSIVINAHY